MGNEDMKYIRMGFISCDSEEQLDERIVKKGSKWQVQSEDGKKNLGTYDTKKEAEKRLRQVHYFKHANEELDGPGEDMQKSGAQDNFDFSSVHLTDADRAELTRRFKKEYPNLRAFNGNSMYLLPDGTYLDMGDAHGNSDWIMEEFFQEKLGIDELDAIEALDEVEGGHIPENFLGFAHIGNDHWNYLGLPKGNLTERQYEALNSYYDYHREKEWGYSIEAYVGRDGYDEPASHRVDVYYDSDVGGFANRFGRKIDPNGLLRNFYRTGSFRMRESVKEGLSKTQEEFFRDSVVRDRKGELIPMWHCSTDVFTSFRNKINWFSASKEYASQFGLSKPVFYEAYLNCKNLLNCGDTGNLAYLPLPTKRILTREALNIAKRMGISEGEMDELCQYAIKDNQKEGSNGMGMKLHAVIRTDAFAEKAKEKGFDGILTIEDGHHCIGVLDPRDIKRVTNTEPTRSPDIDS